ncbi:flippase [soil metagenome]
MVHNERSIFRNTAFTAAGRGAGDLFAFLFLIVFARTYGDDALGEFSFAMAVGALLTLLVLLGMNSLLVREIAQQPAEGPRLVGSLAGLQLLLAALVFGGLLLVSGFVVDGSTRRQILLIVILYQLVHALCLPFTGYFRAREQTQYGAALEAGHKALILALGTIAVLAAAPPQIALIAYPLAAVAMYAGGYTLVTKRHAAPQLRVDLTLSRRWIRTSLPLFVFSILGVLELRAGIIFLGATGDAAAVGLYAAGDRLISAASLLLVMFNGAVFPVMSRLAATPVELARLLARCVRLAVMFAVPVATALILLREPLIELVFGEAFGHAADVLGILAAAMVPAAVNGLGTMLFVAEHRLPAMLKIQLLGVATFFAAMTVFVTTRSFTGLAWSVLIMKLVISIATLIYLHRIGHGLPLWTILRGPLAASAGMIAVFLLSAELPLALRLALMAAAAPVMLVVCKGVEPHDLAYVRRILGKTG